MRTFDLLRTYQLDNLSNKEIFSSTHLGEYLHHLFQDRITGLPENTKNTVIKVNNPYRFIIEGDYLVSNGNGIRSDSLAYTYFEKAYVLGNTTHNKIVQAEAVKRLLLYNFKSQENLGAFEHWVKIYKKLAYDEFERIYYGYFEVGLKMSKAYYLKENSDGLEESILYYIERAQQNNYSYLEARLLQLLGNYLDLFEDNRKSLKVQEEALKIYQSKSAYAYSSHVNDMLFNIAYYHYLQGQNQSLEYLKSIPLNKIGRKDYKDKILIYDLYYEIYKKNKNIDSALYYLEKKQMCVDSLNAINKAVVIEEINTKYQTAQKEKQILEEQALKKRNQNIAIGLGGSLVLLTIIGTLLYRNTKRKQRIAEQEKELQIQKTTTVLKEQEINTINAMVEGQEKERLRIARDLHDNLGGTLAAVKMHIGNLQLNLETSKNPKELLGKANELISEAYTNVRSIAHERNSGVIAKQGLLPAIQKLASTISSSGGLHIEVHDFGLEERLSNHLEITIFRIVQELVTNVIKHANASELQISLTQHEKELNIVVEDNGNGFVVGKLQEKDGMGLGSIERRVEHLEGTMLVDSTLEKGTNIIIDIPL